MADTYSDRLGLIKMEEGSHSNEWGDLSNLNLQRLDAATRGYTKITLAGAETLDSNDITATGSTAEEESFFAFIEFAGTSGTVTVPAENIVWTVYNNADADFTFQPAGGTGVTLTQGKVHTIIYGSNGTTFTDVTNLMLPNSPTFTGDVTISTATPELNITSTQASDYKSINFSSTAGIEGVVAHNASAEAINISCRTSNNTDIASLIGLNQAGSVNFYTGGTNGGSTTLALTLNASQNATFAGDVDMTGVLTVNEDTGLGAARIDIKADTTNPASVLFSDDAANRARITSTTTDDLVLQTSSSLTTALTLDSSQNATFAGDVLVSGKIELENNENLNWKTAAGASRVMMYLDTGDDLIIGNIGLGDGNDRTIFNTESNANVLILDGTTATFAGTVTATNYTATTVQTASAGEGVLGGDATAGAVIRGSGSTNDIQLQNSSDQNVMVVPTGTVNATFAGAITATGGQIAFPATQAASADANTLDDYEEGEFTATISVGAGSVTLLGASDTLAYTKIGRLVHVQGYLSVTSVSGPSGPLTIGTLPFAAADITDTAGEGFAVGLMTNPASGSQRYVSFNITEGATGIVAQEVNSNNLGGEMQSSTAFYVNITYIAET